MKKVKHSKIKNTGILFELLTKQVTSDILNDIKAPKSVGMIKKYFNKSKPLGQELQLYKMLTTEKFDNENQAVRFLDETIKYRKKLSNASLNTSKYNLIKEVRDNYPINEFFSSKINNYKLNASIYNLFLSETTEATYSPKASVKNRFFIVENLQKSPNKKGVAKDKAMKSYIKEDKDLRLLSYRILVDNFNSKYKNLNTPQKKLLKEFINNISNTNSLKDHIVGEKEKVKRQLKTLIPKITDKVTKIKVKEAHNSLDSLTLNKGKVAKEKDVLTLMRYYELVKELKKVNNNIKEKILTNG